ncbi:MAG TPA: alkaline shock response membrane anchor protein AmaP [Thermoanaerobacterales bacterium]|nr:alkaline shock response membrane anchor protein AmaP [Thermoanaerobacterales bacterium]
MKLLDRIILTIYSLCFVILAVVMLLVSFKVISLNYCLTYIRNIYGRWETGVAGLIFLIISIKFLLSSIKRNKSYKKLISVNDMGEIRISDTAIENIVVSTVKDILGVKDVKVSINSHKNNINLVIKIVATSDRNVPETADDIRKYVKENIERITGIKIKEAEVIIENIITSNL